eukprot:963149-Amphidinium_carterae.3
MMTSILELRQRRSIRIIHVISGNPVHELRLFLCNEVDDSKGMRVPQWAHLRLILDHDGCPGGDISSSSQWVQQLDHIRSQPRKGKSRLYDKSAAGSIKSSAYKRSST